MTEQSQNNSGADRLALRKLAQRLAAQSNPTQQASNASAEAVEPTAESSVSNTSYRAIRFSRAKEDQERNAALEARYQSNMAAFFKYDPNTYQKFCSYRPSEPLELVYTKSGHVDVYFLRKEELFYKNDDPVDLCNRQVDIVLKTCPFQQVYYNIGKDELGQIHHRYLRQMSEFQGKYIPENANPLLANSCPSAIVLGVGLGYHLSKLYDDIEIGNLLLIEPNLDLFYASLYTFDWAKLLEYVVANNRGLYLMIGQTKDEIFNDLTDFYSRHGHMLAGFMWTMIHYRSAEITAIADQLSLDYDRSYAAIGFLDDAYFCISHGSYLISHHAHFVRSDVDLPEYMRDIPVCVVANGPSLSNDLPFLRKVQDKVLIIACGSAMETLFNAGIKPLFYAATERLKVVAESLTLIPDKEFIQDAILVSSDVCHPDTFNMFKHTALFSKSDEVFFSMAGLKFFDLYRKVQGACMINPLVGNLGVVTASMFKFKNVYFFGLDNGTKQLGVLHPDESILYKNNEKRKQQHKEEVELDITGKPIPSMHTLSYTFPGNFDGTVHSSYLYKLSLRYIELIVETTNKEINYYNCSDGAKIKGVEPKHAEELLDDWLQLPDVDVDAVRDFIENEKTFDLNISEDELETIVDHNAFNLVIESLRHILTKHEPIKTRLEYVFLLERACEILYKFTDRRFYFAVQIINGSINQFFMMIIRVLYLTAEEDLAIERANIHLGWILDFLDDAKQLYQHVPYYYAEDHFKFFKDDKVGFDHPDSIAPKIIRREPLVNQEERDNYPHKKFVKRYE